MAALDAATRDVVIEQFRALDRDGNGTVEEAELRGVLQALDDTLWTDDMVHSLFVAADCSKDARINLEEFMSYLFSDARKAPQVSLVDLTEEQRLELLTNFRSALAKLPCPGVAEPFAEPRALVGVAHIGELRKRFMLSSVPPGLETRISLHFIKHFVRRGAHELKLTRLVPDASHGSGRLLCLLEDDRGSSVAQHVYSVVGGALARLDEGVEVMDVAEARLPRELKLLCRLSVASGGGETCKFSTAKPALAASGLVSDAELEGLELEVRQQYDVNTLEDVLLEVMEFLCVEQGSPEAEEMWAMARANPEKTLAELGAMGVFVNEPDLSIDWLVAQLPHAA